MMRRTGETIGPVGRSPGSIQNSVGGGLAAGPRRAAVGHTRAPRLPFRRQPWVSLPGSSVVRLPQMGWVVVRLGGAP
jgi:hypothetical protein